MGAYVSMPAAATYLSVIVPAYNEARSIGRALEAMRAFLDRQPYTYEIIVSADGDDGTRELVAEMAKGDPRLSVIGSTARGGKGMGIRNGVARARGEIIGFADADYKTPIEELAKLLPFFEQGFDVVIGSRATPDSLIERYQPLYRRLGSKVFGFVVHMLMGVGHVPDTQCGFKFFTRQAAQDIFKRQRVDGYMFDIEILRLAKRLGYRLRNVGVRWKDDGDSRYDPIGGTWKNLKELARIRFMRYDDLTPTPREASASSAVAKQGSPVPVPAATAQSTAGAVK
jgi:dolichyl-phosphate beta-glucosyltransferase